MAAVKALIIFKLWELYDSHVFRKYAAQSRRILLPSAPRYSPGDVSIVIPTVDTPEALIECLSSQLLNHPHEIVIVTIMRDKDRVLELVEKVDDPDGKIRVLTVEAANKRRQMVCGIQATTGEILALVDDDTIWPTPAVLPYLLAGFEDATVGGAVGGQAANIPSHRLTGSGLTIWEVAGIRALDNQVEIQNARFAADSGCICLVGRTSLVRAEILKDPSFQLSFTSESWMGVTLNSGDDAFITRWLMAHGWHFSVQSAPDAKVITAVMEDSRFLKQLARWKRNGIRFYTKSLFWNPGFWRLYPKYPYCTGRMIKALTQPLWTWLNIWGWIETLRSATGWEWAVPTILATWYLWSEYNKFRMWAIRFPSCSGRNIAGAWLADNAYILVDLYAYVTIGTSSWMTRSGAQ